MVENDENLYQSFISTQNENMFRLVVNLGMDPDELKQIAIKILNNPNRTQQEQNAVCLFINFYKKMVIDGGRSIPKTSDAKSIGVDNNGRRTDLRIR